MALQRQAGNRAVSRLVAQRRTTGGTKPAAKPGSAKAGSAKHDAPAKPGPSGATPSAGATGTAASAADRDATAPADAVVQRLADGTAGARSGPKADPGFATLTRDVRSTQHRLAKHPPPKAEANAAQGAAKPPQDDKEAQGKAANAEKMNAAKPGDFNKAAFIKAVNDAIAKQAPKNLDEADKFGDSGKAAAVKGEVQGKVGAGKQASAKAIETTTKAPPDTSKAKEKPVTPLRPDRPPPKPGAPNPAQAVPGKAPPAATDFSDGPGQVDQQMADAEVTEEQLAKSHEPEFTGALKEKKAGEAHAATAPGQVRGAEAKTLAGAKAQAAQAGAAAMTTMAADRTKAGKDVGAGKEGAKSDDEKKREQVTATLQKVFDATKKDVEDILGGLDKKVDDKFDAGEKAARNAFTAEYTRKIDAYKDKRYSGVNFWKWGKDKLFGLPGEVNAFYEQARKGYVDRMQGVISGVADVIGAELTRAKQRIAKGRDELQAEVKKLPADLQAIGKESAAEFSGKFDELTRQVNDKGTRLVDTLASKYTEALKAVDEEIAAEKEKNKGLVAKAIDAVKGVIDTILKLKDLLLGVLAKAAQAVGAIIKDPIGFLGKLVSAVGAGLKAFIANIANHLKKGLVSWLLGAAAKAGLQLPERFDLKGILGLIASLLGLTWAAIRGRVVSKGVPEQAMGAVESSAPMARKIQSEGIGGVWEQLKDKVGDLKEGLLGKIAQYLIPTVIIAGITWIISLLNPASAFIKACKAIIDIVTFIIDRGAQIIAFVNAVLDAVLAIAGGGAGGVPGLIENALALSVPVLIGFLAALLGIGGLADKVKKLFQSLSKPVMKAVDWIVGKIAAFGKKLWAKLKSKGKGKDGKNADTAAGKVARERAAIADAEKLLKSKPTHEQVESRVPAVERKHQVSLHLVVESKTDTGEVVHVQTARTDSHQIAAAEESRKKLVNENLLKRGTDFVGKVLVHWWEHQLAKTKLWPASSILDDTGKAGQQKLTDGGFQQHVYTKHFAGKTTHPDKPGVWDTTVFSKGSGVRTELVKTLGKHAEGRLRPAVVKYAAEAPGAERFKDMAFDPAENPYGEFDPLPAGSKDANADLVKAVRSCGDIIGFLKAIGVGRTVEGIDHKKFRELWDTDSNSKNWIKNEYRRADEGKHEWIPTNYIAEVLEVAVRGLADAQRGAKIAEDWITLQHRLRSFTSHVIWDVILHPRVREVGREGIEAHVGGFTKTGNPMFNGKDSKWHNDLRGYFKDFVAAHPTGTPAKFLDSLLEKLENGLLMWDGDLADVSPAARNLPIDATYKMVTVSGASVSEETVVITHESGITISRLGAIQSTNFNRVRLDFTRARAALQVK